MKALIFGTFNPVTNAHVAMGVTASDVLDADEVIYVPTADSYLKTWKGYKDGNILPADIRIKLLKRAISFYATLKVSTVETDGIVDGKTYNTLMYFKKKYCEKIVLCVGSDNLEQFTRWYRYRDILKEFPMLVFRRGPIGEEALEVLNTSPHILITDLEHPVTEQSYDVRAPKAHEYLTTSSTLVRECYVNKDLDTIRGIVPNNVYKYLEEHINDRIYF